ncbi:MAG: hypothetical protein GVY12_11460 [Bacteroidetes bacterium]|jgi:sugar lactone lactonase YvrE|nr:hypothetical protein [Bacteroidota bacterium]
MRYAALVAFTFLLILPACQPETPSSAERAERPDPVEATVDLELGEADGDAPYLFGRIAGVAVDDDGRIFVADRQGSTIRAYDAEGTYLYAVADMGEGPGEVNRPCCLAFGPEGHLWVRDDQNRRYARFAVTAAGGTPAGTVRIEHSMFGLAARTTFDAEGHLIDVGAAQPEGENASQRARLHRSMDNETVRTVFLPEAPEGRLPIYEAQIGGGVAFIPQPMGPREQHAHSPTGTWAHAITDTYTVTWLDAAGDTLHVLQRDVEGPALSDEERERADQSLRRWSEQLGVSRASFPFGVPERKPVLANIFFDTDGCLWVQRSVEDGAPSEADVYTRDGTLAQVVQWPAGIDLSSGHLTADTLYGIRQDGDTFPQVVRLRY